MNPLKTIIRNFIKYPLPGVSTNDYLRKENNIKLPCNHVSPACCVRTGRTLIWFFSSVSPLVSWQVIGSRKNLKSKFQFFEKSSILFFCALTFYCRSGYNSDRRLNDYLVVNDLGQKPCLNYGLQIKVTSNCFVIFEQNCIQNYDS